MRNSILLEYKYVDFFDTKEVSIDISELLYNVEIYGMIGRGKTRLVCSNECPLSGNESFEHYYNNVSVLENWYCIL